MDNIEKINKPTLEALEDVKRRCVMVSGFGDTNIFGPYDCLGTMWDAVNYLIQEYKK